MQLSMATNESISGSDLPCNDLLGPCFYIISQLAFLLHASGHISFELHTLLSATTCHPEPSSSTSSTHSYASAAPVFAGSLSGESINFRKKAECILSKDEWAWISIFPKRRNRVSRSWPGKANFLICTWYCEPPSEGADSAIAAHYEWALEKKIVERKFVERRDDEELKMKALASLLWL